MARKKPVYKDDYDEFEDEKEYEDDYDDYDGGYEEENYRNPLKPMVIVLVILLLLFAAIIGLLYIRLQASEKQVTELSTTLSVAQTELNRMQAEAASATPAPVNTPTPAPTQEPTPTPTPESTPEPTQEPTPTPAPDLKDTITDEVLAGVFRPKDENWFEAPRNAWVSSEYMLSVHWGPGMEWLENMVLYRNNPVEILAEQNNWYLLRTPEGKYGWASKGLLTETVPAGVATPTPQTDADPI